MKKFKRVFLIVMDSVGIGELPDAAKYGDAGTNTIVHIANTVHGLKMPNMEKLGYGNITHIEGIPAQSNPMGSYGKCMERSVGKDTMTGHWEIMGIETTSPFITFTDTGFPKELIQELEEKSGRHVIGNKSASGTEILVELGEEQMRTGDLIVYTSADSVLQIAAHEEIIPLEELYHICHIAREITMKPEWRVGRIIARPYIGTNKNNFTRTSNRHDYALAPTGKTVMDSLKEKGYDSIAIGKISDIFDGMGVTEKMLNKSNHDGMDHIIEYAQKDFNGLAFLNLVDFDAMYGHRRNPQGYAECLEEFDQDLGELLKYLTEEDLLIITADHGNDPTHTGTDHTREYIPLVIYSPGLNSKDLGVRKSFADIGATVAENFDVEMPKIGESFLKELNR